MVSQLFLCTAVLNAVFHYVSLCWYYDIQIPKTAAQSNVNLIPFLPFHLDRFIIFHTMTRQNEIQICFQQKHDE